MLREKSMSQSDGTAITCPHCQTVIPLSDAIARPIEDRLRAQFQAEAAKKEADLRAREQRLTQTAQQLDQARQDIQRQVALRVVEETKKITAEQENKAKEAVEIEFRALQQQLEQKHQKLVAAQEAELKLRNERAEFEEQKRSLELEIARRTDAVKEAVSKSKDEEFRLKELEKNTQMDHLKRQIDELKRKAEQGSQQAQGEALELDLESALRRCFAADDIAAVPKGVHGGDLLQQVHDDGGHPCGTIIWESKRTKAWNEGWIDKLKDDRLAAKAQLAVIVSTATPRDVGSFDCLQSVWVTRPNLAVPLAAALRVSLIETAAARRAIEGRQDKMAAVYDYLSGPEFKGRVTAIVEAFTAMREDLENEKRAIQKQWARREKLIERVLGNTVGMYGEVSGIIGRALPAIELLALPEDGNGRGE
jgi:hypothetical protein